MMLYFIHGLNGSASDWAPFMDFFRDHGFSCHAVDLKEGFNLRSVHVMDYVKKVSSLVTNEDVVIGHSMGGLIMQKVAEQNQLKAGVGICSAPPQNISMKRISLYRQLRYIPNILFNIPFKPSFGLVQDVFLNDVDEQMQRNIYQNLQKQSVHVTVEVMKQKIVVDEERISCPVHFIGRKLDVTIPIDVVKRIADKYGSSFEVVAGNHYIFVGWKDVAERVLSFLKRIQ